MFGSQRLSRAVALISSRCRYLELRWYRPAPPPPARLYLLSSERSGRSSPTPTPPPEDQNRLQGWVEPHAGLDDRRWICCVWRLCWEQCFWGEGGCRFIKWPACFGTHQTSITDRLHWWGHKHTINTKDRADPALNFTGHGLYSRN